MKIIFNYFFLPFLRPSASPLRSAASDFPFRPLSRTSARRQRRLRPVPVLFPAFPAFSDASTHQAAPPPSSAFPAVPRLPVPSFSSEACPISAGPPFSRSRSPTAELHVETTVEGTLPPRSHAFPSHHVTIIAGHSPPPRRNAGVAVEAARPTPSHAYPAKKSASRSARPRAPTFCPSPPTLPPSASSFSGRPAPPPSPAFPAVPRLSGPSFSAEACPLSAGPPRSHSPLRH